MSAGRCRVLLRIAYHFVSSTPPYAAYVYAFTRSASGGEPPTRSERLPACHFSLNHSDRELTCPTRSKRSGWLVGILCRVTPWDSWLTPPDRLPHRLTVRKAE